MDGMAFKTSKNCEPDWPDIQLHFLSYSVASDHGVRLIVATIIILANLRNSAVDLRKTSDGFRRKSVERNL